MSCESALVSSNKRCSLWYPQIQITFKHFNPKTKEKIWKSINVTHFVTPPPEGTGRDKTKKHDKRSCKADQFSVIFNTDAEGNDSYTIDANMDTDLQLSYTYTRPKESLGWKVGAGPQGGKSFFGSNAASPDGYVVHRFWPQAYTSGHIISKGKAIDAKGTGMFIHAIQGMRPNLIASRWNFANFQSTSGPEKVAAIMMEFTTTSDYGGPVIKKNEKEGTSKRDTISVNIGSITVGGQLVAVTAASRKASASDEELSKGSHTIVQHLDPVLDSETGYKVPQTVRYAWQGPLLKDGKAQGDVVEAELKVNLGKPTPSEAKGLIEKVDVLGEIPLLVRKVVNYVAGTKPYVYQVCTPRQETVAFPVLIVSSFQFINPATLKVALPASYNGDSPHNLEVPGTLFNESTFISEP